MEIDIPTGGGSNTIKTYWPAGLGVEITTGGAPTYNWTHSDNLDSVVAITNASGGLVQSMAYDAWGARRDLAGDPGIISAANGTLSGQTLIDNKGFTHQEELDQLGLVHLNGRVYDPFTGRFLSGDPLVQDPYHSQSYNRYTYVWNNPTNMTDPTGFEGEGMDYAASDPEVRDSHGMGCNGFCSVTTVHSDGSKDPITVTHRGDGSNFMNTSVAISAWVAAGSPRGTSYAYNAPDEVPAGGAIADNYGPQEGKVTRGGNFYSTDAPPDITKARTDPNFGAHEKANWNNSQPAGSSPAKEQMLVVLQKDDDKTQFIYLTKFAPNNHQGSGNLDSITFVPPENFRMPDGYHMFMQEHSHPFSYCDPVCNYLSGYLAGPSQADMDVARDYSGNARPTAVNSRAYNPKAYFVIQSATAVYKFSSSEPVYWYYGPRVESEQRQ